MMRMNSRHCATPQPPLLFIRQPLFSSGRDAADAFSAITPPRQPLICLADITFAYDIAIAFSLRYAIFAIRYAIEDY
jgi:hypothetical protein